MQKILTLNVWADVKVLLTNTVHGTWLGPRARSKSFASADDIELCPQSWHTLFPFQKTHCTIIISKKVFGMCPLPRRMSYNKNLLQNVNRRNYFRLLLFALKRYYFSLVFRPSHVHRRGKATLNKWHTCFKVPIFVTLVAVKLSILFDTLPELIFSYTTSISRVK